MSLLAVLILPGGRFGREGEAETVLAVESFSATCRSLMPPDGPLTRGQLHSPVGTSQALTRETNSAGALATSWGHGGTMTVIC